MSVSGSGTTTLVINPSGPDPGTPPVLILEDDTSAAIGNTTVGLDKIAVITDTKHTIQVTFAGESITGLRLWGDGLGGGTGTALVRAVVYEDDGGEWGALFEEGEEVEVVENQPGGFIFLPFSSPLTPTGTYHIGFHVGGDSPILRIAQITALLPNLTGLDTYSDGASDPGGEFEVEDRSFTICALVGSEGGGPGGGTLYFTENLTPGDYWYDVYTENDDDSTRLSANRYPLHVEVPQIEGGGVHGYTFRVTRSVDPDPDILRLYKVASSALAQLAYDEKVMSPDNKIGIRLLEGEISYSWHDGTSWEQLDVTIPDTDWSYGVIALQSNSAQGVLDNPRVRQPTGLFGTGEVVWEENFDYEDGTLKNNITWLDNFYDDQITMRITDGQVTQNDDTFYQDNYTIQEFGEGDYEIQLVQLPGEGEHIWFTICGVPQSEQVAGRYYINNTFDDDTLGGAPSNWTNLSRDGMVSTSISVQDEAGDRYMSLRGASAVAGTSGYVNTAYNIGLDYSKDVPRAVKIVFDSVGPGSTRIYLFRDVKTGSLESYERYIRLRHEGTTMYLERMQDLPDTPEIMDTIEDIPAGKITVWLELTSTTWRVKINGVDYDTAMGDGEPASHTLFYTKGHFHTEIVNSSTTQHEFKLYEIVAMASIPSPPVNVTATLDFDKVTYYAEPKSLEDQVTLYGFQLTKAGVDYRAPIEGNVVPLVGSRPEPGTYIVEAYVENESPW